MADWVDWDIVLNIFGDVVIAGVGKSMRGLNDNGKNTLKKF